MAIAAAAADAAAAVKALSSEDEARLLGFVRSCSGCRDAMAVLCKAKKIAVDYKLILIAAKPQSSIGKKNLFLFFLTSSQFAAVAGVKIFKSFLIIYTRISVKCDAA